MTGDTGRPGEGQREGGGQVKVWRRWTGEGNVPFHRYCEIWPTTLPPIFSAGEEYPEGEEPPLSFTPPLARWALRHTPFLVLTAMVVAAVLDFAGAAIRTVTDLFDIAVTPVTVGVLVLVLGWAIGLLWLAWRVLEVSGTDTAHGITVYGLVSLLTVALALNMYATIPQKPVSLPAGLEEGIQTFGPAFFWLLLVGGLLVYDGMLKTENMFSKLDEKRPPVVDDSGEYERFVNNLRADLTHTTSIDDLLPQRVASLPPFRWIRREVRTTYLFAGLFVLPFFLIWWFFPSVSGPGPDSNVVVRGLVAVTAAALDFFLVVVFFQFMVVVVYFNRLLSDTDPEADDRADVTLLYSPNHYDDFAGFRDLGRFATRVNILLVVGGIYMATHLYDGLRVYPEIDQTVTVEVLAWGIRSFLPLVVYIFAVTVWFYLSFWQIHKTMRRGRERKLEECASRSEEPDPELRSGPVWPVNNQVLVSNISIDFVPLLTFLPFFRF